MFRQLVLFILLFTFCSCSTGTKVDPGFMHFKIYIEQDNTIKDIENREVSLDKKPFVLMITFTGPDSIFVNASFVSDSYYAVKEGENVSEIVGFEGTGIVEELFNIDEVLMVSKKSPNFWHYNNDNDHRFNEIQEKSGVIICRRKISNIMNIDNAKEKIPISEIKENEIYLVFMKLEWNKNYSKKIEIKRDYLKLNFR